MYVSVIVSEKQRGQKRVWQRGRRTTKFLAFYASL